MGRLEIKFSAAIEKGRKMCYTLSIKEEGAEI
jgi:hypothetical protein